MRILNIDSSPHFQQSVSTADIMRNVVFALLPAAAFSIYWFGLPALLILLVASSSCVFTEYLLCRWSGKASTVNDWSALITGLLFGMTLPPTLPLWMVAVGGMIAIGFGKFLFGGLGYNAFNPALVGRAVLQAAFPVAMTTWHPVAAAERLLSLPSSTLAVPFTKPVYTAVTGATPLADMKFAGVMTPTADLLLGTTSGSSGETCALLILVGGCYLAVRKMLNWRIPAAILLTVAGLGAILNWWDPAYPGPVFMMFSGGLMLGAVFMATDMVASPLTNSGVLVYGIFIGVFVVVIRYWGGLPEGVMYAILLGNAVSPHIDRYFQPLPYGTKIEGKYL